MKIINKKILYITLLVVLFILMVSILEIYLYNKSQDFKKQIIELQKSKEWKIVFSTGSSELYYLDINKGAIPIFNADDRKDLYKNHPSFSSAGNKIVFSATDILKHYLITTNIDGSNPQKLMERETEGINYPSWSPDTKNILFLAGTYDEIDTESFVAKNISTKLHFINIQNEIIKTFNESRAFSFYPPSWSPDGKNIVYQTVDRDIMIADIDTLKIKKLTKGEAPSWSNNINKIAYREGKLFYTISPDGNNKKLLFKNPKGIENPILYSPDGKFILFYKTADIFFGDWDANVYIMNIESQEKLKIGNIQHLTGISWYGKK